MTTLNERPTEVEGFKRSVSGKRLLMFAVLVLAVALVGVAIRGTNGQDATTPDEEIQQLLDQNRDRLARSCSGLSVVGGYRCAGIGVGRGHSCVGLGRRRD